MTATVGAAERLGIKPDMVVQEVGWDEDVDDQTRTAIEECIGGELLDENATEAIDVVLLWWRDGDGDLGDTLVEVRTLLNVDGMIWVLTPKEGHPGHVEPSAVADAAKTVALSDEAPMNLTGDWSATRLTASKSKL
ncbi:DUF3052 domain-containing protein [Streptomyces sp. NPDC051183]|uniref:DUF3052 domain-containing protein n=1 Tax=Streptomyces sp. NPDC051183 TaxID=3155165 RepID=UPI00343D3E61